MHDDEDEEKCIGGFRNKFRPAGLFVTDGDLSREDMDEMAETCINVEDDEELANALIDIKLDAMEDLDASENIEDKIMDDNNDDEKGLV